jgi:hypothetical protein
MKSTWQPPQPAKTYPLRFGERLVTVRVFEPGVSGLPPEKRQDSVWRNHERDKENS